MTSIKIMKLNEILEKIDELVDSIDKNNKLGFLIGRNNELDFIYKKTVESLRKKEYFFLKISKNNLILNNIMELVILKKMYEGTKFLERYKNEIRCLSNIKIRKFFREKNEEKNYKTNGNFIIKVKNEGFILSDFEINIYLFEYEKCNKEEEIQRILLDNAYVDLKILLKYILHSYNTKIDKNINTDLVILSIISSAYKKVFSYKESIFLFQESYEFYKRIQKILNYKIEEIIDILKFLKNLFYKNYGEKGIEFIEKKSVIIGLFAAIGEFLDSDNFNLNDIKKQFEKNIKKVFDLEKFTKMKKNVDVTLFYITDIVKETVYYLTLNLLKDKLITFDNFHVDNLISYKKFIKELKNVS